MSKKFMLGVMFVLVVVAMLVLAVAAKARFPMVNRAVSFVMLPVENSIASVVRLGDGARGYWRSLTVLQDENEQLKKDNAELRNANISMAAIYAENLQLRALLDYKNQHHTQSTVAAKVIARNFGDLRDSFYIDAGEDKGLRKDMAVINGAGLIGVIDEVYGAYAKVLLITSPNCKIGARVLRSDSRAVGVISGCGSASENLRMEHIFSEADIRKEDVIVTSGYSGNHPENILIGKVAAARKDSVGLLKEADVIPAADIADVEHILVITSFAPAAKIDVLPQGGQAK